MKKFLICLITSVILLTFVCPVQAAEKENTHTEIKGLTFDHSMELTYAEQFSVDYYKDGYALITIAEEGQFLVVPEGKEAPEDLDPKIAVIQKPVENIYLVATSAMNLFCALDDWTISVCPEQMLTAGILRKQKKPWRTAAFPLQENTVPRIMS